MPSRAGDFTPQAAAYARARPGYPGEMADRLVALAAVRSGEAVAELGAGTGLFTALLAARRLAVTAVEPNAAMRQLAPPLPGVVWRPGTFEATGLEPASQAWAVAAQAFHWADPPRALPELHRVLAPGRSLSVLWNNRDNDASPVLAMTRSLIQELVPGFDEGYRDRDWAAVLTATGHFERPQQTTVRHVVAMPRERYLDLWRSHNLLTSTAGPQKLARLLTALGERLADTAEVAVPYVCRAWTVRRRP